jgi:WD40 repeat protein
MTNAHSHGVTCVHVEEDGPIVTGSWDGTVKVWKWIRKLRMAGAMESGKPSDSESDEWTSYFNTMEKGVNSGQRQSSRNNDAEMSNMHTLDSMWESGNMDDGVTIGELVNRVQGDRVRDHPPSVSSNDADAEDCGYGNLELELIRTIHTQGI